MPKIIERAKARANAIYRIESRITDICNPTGLLSPFIQEYINGCMAQILKKEKLNAEQWEQSVKVCDLYKRVGDILGLEWPRECGEKLDRISYCPNEQAVSQAKRIECSLGSYLQRLMPDLSGQEIELLVVKARDRNKIEFKFLRDKELVEQMYRMKAHSCMCPCQGQWKDHSLHPYNAYSSRLGWAMAVKVDNDGYCRSRAIVRPDDKTFIRIYGSKDTGEHSAMGEDPALRAWLTELGFKLVNDWKNCSIERIKKDGTQNNAPIYCAPYIDGNIKKCRLPKDDPSILIVCNEGNYSLESTNGQAYRLFEDREGMVRLHNGEWVDTDLAIAGYMDRMYLRETAIFVERRHNWFPPELTICVDGIPQFREDCCSNAIDSEGNTVPILLEDTVSAMFPNGRCVNTHKKNVLLDYKDTPRFKAHILQMTGGQFIGKWALAKKTVTRKFDGCIVLKASCRSAYTVTQAQWEPGLGDKVRLNPKMINEPSERNPLSTDGRIVGNVSNYCTILWDNGKSNCYRLLDDLFILVQLAQDVKEPLPESIPFVVGIGQRVILSTIALDRYQAARSNPEDVPGTIISHDRGWWQVKWDNGTHNSYESEDCFLPAMATTGELIHA